MYMYTDIHIFTVYIYYTHYLYTHFTYTYTLYIHKIYIYIYIYIIYMHIIFTLYIHHIYTIYIYIIYVHNIYIYIIFIHNIYIYRYINTLYIYMIFFYTHYINIYQLSIHHKSNSLFLFQHKPECLLLTKLIHPFSPHFCCFDIPCLVNIRWIFSFNNSFCAAQATVVKNTLRHCGRDYSNADFERFFQRVYQHYGTTARQPRDRGIWRSWYFVAQWYDISQLNIYTYII